MLTFSSDFHIQARQSQILIDATARPVSEIYADIFGNEKPQKALPNDLNEEEEKDSLHSRSNSAIELGDLIDEAVEDECSDDNSKIEKSTQSPFQASESSKLVRSETDEVIAFAAIAAMQRGATLHKRKKNGDTVSRFFQVCLYFCPLNTPMQFELSL